MYMVFFLCFAFFCKIYQSSDFNGLFCERVTQALKTEEETCFWI